MEIVRYDAPFVYTEVFKVWEEIFGLSEAQLEELQINGSESEYNNDYVYAAKENGKIIGLVHSTIPTAYPDFCGIGGVCTTPEARGKGIGKILFEKMVEDLDIMGVQTSFLCTGNMIAAKLYGKNGFEFYPGTYIMYRQKDGKIIDFLNQTYKKDPGEIRVIEGNQSFRIPLIPLILNSVTEPVADINTSITTEPFVLGVCMSLYPRYLKLKEKGGYYFGAISESNLLGGMSSVLPTELGNRCDFFWSAKFAESVPELIKKCSDAVGDIYFQIADSSKSKIDAVCQLGYAPCESVNFVRDECVIPMKIYRK